ncbi:MAG: DUF4876 domain-containing protein [bacterium]
MRYGWIVVVTLLLAASGCETLPPALEQTAQLQLKVEDNSNFMKSLYGSTNVRQAEVWLKSTSYGIEYKFFTDSLGVAHLEGLTSDLYNIAIVRQLDRSEVEKVTGAAIPRRLSGGLSSLVIRADQPSSLITVKVDLQPISDIVISELYTCGAPGAGLYWHDKYVEICNISEEIVYLDGILIAEVYKGFLSDPFIRSKEVWKFPGRGKDYPIKPGQFMVIATDGIDHRVNAPLSVDLSKSAFEFYLWTGPDIENPLVPDMILIYQPAGFDWLMGGELDAFVLARVANVDSLQYVDEHLLIPKSDVIDGVEYLKDPTRLDQKKLDPTIDAGAAGGIQFYTGLSQERKMRTSGSRWTLEDNNNSSLDFVKIPHPTPGYHYTTGSAGKGIR